MEASGEVEDDDYTIYQKLYCGTAAGFSFSQGLDSLVRDHLDRAAVFQTVFAREMASNELGTAYEIAQKAAHVVPYSLSATIFFTATGLLVGTTLYYALPEED